MPRGAFMMPAGFRQDLRRVLTVHEGTRAGQPWTQVTIGELRIPHPGPAGPAKFLVTTQLNARLSAAGFAPRIARRVNSASEVKGRVVYGVDLELMEVVAAASYHLPLATAEPLEVTALAPRIDSLAPLGRACVPILKACIHEIAAKLGRPTVLHLRASGRSAAEAKDYYGFKRARARGRGLASSPASEFLVQAAPNLAQPPSSSQSSATKSEARRLARRG